MVLDTEVYSNTVGQMSKATPLGAVQVRLRRQAETQKDLGMMVMATATSTWPGWRSAPTICSRQGVLEAEALRRTSILICYCHCIAHGYDLITGSISRRRPCNPDTGRCTVTIPNWGNRQESAATGFARPEPAARQVHLQRNALHYAGAQQSGAAKHLLALAERKSPSAGKLYEHLAPCRANGKLQEAIAQEVRNA